MSENGEKKSYILSIAKEIATTPLAPINFARHIPELCDRLMGWKWIGYGVGAMGLLMPIADGLVGLRLEDGLETAAARFASTWLVESVFIKILRLDRRSPIVSDQAIEPSYNQLRLDI